MMDEGWGLWAGSHHLLMSDTYCNTLLVRKIMTTFTYHSTSKYLFSVTMDRIYSRSLGLSSEEY